MEPKRTHKQTLIFLLFSLYICAMFFFMIIRALGLLWFQQTNLDTTFPSWVVFFLMFFFWILDGALTLKTLTDCSWPRIFFILGFFRLILFIHVINQNFSGVLELALVIVIPLIFVKDKANTLGRSILYFITISLYQLVMMLGRGYPTISKFSLSWQILSMIDYHMFLFLIYMLKEGKVMFSPGPGCWFFFGKFDAFATKIGNFILKPFAPKK